MEQVTLTGKLPQLLAEMGYQPMETAPEQEMVRLLVMDDYTRLEDEIAEVPTPTIGYRDAVGWQIVGWDWCHDRFCTSATAKPVGWKHFDDVSMDILLQRLREAEALGS